MRWGVAAEVQRHVDGTIKLLNGDVGLGYALSPVLARHTLPLVVFVLMISHMNTRLLRRFRHERAGCSSGGEWPLPPEGIARAEVFGVYHDLRASCSKRRRCAAIIAGASCTGKCARHIYLCLFFRRELFSSRCGGRAWAAALGHRCWISGGCCGGRAAWRYHCCRSGCEHMLRRHVLNVRIFLNLVSGLTPQVVSLVCLLLWRRAARAARGHRGCRSYWCSQALQDTRHRSGLFTCL